MSCALINAGCSFPHRHSQKDVICRSVKSSDGSNTGMGCKRPTDAARQVQRNWVGPHYTIKFLRLFFFVNNFDEFYNLFV